MEDPEIIVPSNPIKNLLNGDCSERAAELCLWGMGLDNAKAKTVNNISYYIRSSDALDLLSNQMISCFIIDYFLLHVSQLCPEFGVIGSNASKSMLLGNYNYLRHMIPQKNKLFIPIHWSLSTPVVSIIDGNHWLLAYVDIIKQEAKIYDSLAVFPHSLRNPIHQLLQEISPAKWKITLENSPKQIGIVDCGLFLMLFAACIANDIKLELINNKKCEIYRNNIAQFISERY